MGMNNSFKKKDVFKNAHNVHRQRRGGGSLKNTKINYTKDLLRHCLLNFWEDFAILCVCVCLVSVQAVCRSFQGEKNKLSSSLFRQLGSVDAQSSRRSKAQ